MSHFVVAVAVVVVVVVVFVLSSSLVVAQLLKTTTMEGILPFDVLVFVLLDGIVAGVVLSGVDKRRLDAYKTTTITRQRQSQDNHNIRQAQDKTRQSQEKQEKTRQDKTRQDKIKQDKTRQNKTTRNKTKQKTIRQDKTRQRSCDVLCCGCCFVVVLRYMVISHPVLCCLVLSCVV